MIEQAEIDRVKQGADLAALVRARTVPGSCCVTIACWAGMADTLDWEPLP